MSTTTSYGNWTRIEQSITAALGEYVPHFDIDALASEYRKALNNALPKGVSLHGNEFFGPAYNTRFEGFPHTEDGRLDLRKILRVVDFW